MTEIASFSEHLPSGSMLLIKACLSLKRSGQKAQTQAYKIHQETRDQDSAANHLNIIFL